jgi:hypothetical protein
MMRLAWLVYDDDPIWPEVRVVFEQPSSGQYSRVVPIVYAEIQTQPQ